MDLRKLMQSIASKLNSTFWMIGKAMANKMTAKVVGKIKLLLKGEELIWTCHAAKHICEILKTFWLLERFFLILNKNSMVSNFLSCFFPLFAFTWEF